MKIGIVGAGQMGRHHVRVCSELADVELVGVAEEDSEIRTRIAHTFRVRMFSSVTDLLEKASPDALIVAVPTGKHFQIALPLLEAGKHVLIEKPIADTVEHGLALIRAAEKSGAVLVVGHIERFNPAVIEVKRQIDAGLLGKLFHMHARRVGPFPPRIVDVGVTVDLATHDLNVMEHIAGSDALSVFAATEQRLHSSREDMVTAILRYANGAIGTLDINWLTPTKIRELWIAGDKGMFHVNYLTQDLTLFENASGVGSAEVLHVMGVAEGRAIRFPIKRVEPLRAELEHFVQCASGKSRPLVSGVEAVRALHMAQVTVLSAQGKQPMSFSEVKAAAHDQ